MSNGSNTFVRITNKDIYDKLENIELHLAKLNGSVSVNKWVSRSALGFVVGLAGVLFGILKYA